MRYLTTKIIAEHQWCDSFMQSGESSYTLMMYWCSCKYPFKPCHCHEPSLVHKCNSQPKSVLNYNCYILIVISFRLSLCAYCPCYFASIVISPQLFYLFRISDCSIATTVIIDIPYKTRFAAANVGVWAAAKFPVPGKVQRQETEHIWTT